MSKDAKHQKHPPKNALVGLALAQLSAAREVPRKKTAKWPDRRFSGSAQGDRPAVALAFSSQLTIRFVAKSGTDAEQVERALRRLLKYAGRALGLKCTHVERFEG
jgi:hypothetical protein